ncbi:MAG: hypothetical protein Q8904_05295 [Bacteroidota bacterium]|nr:hypothetical protein [Bacteroidota bacterium]
MGLFDFFKGKQSQATGSEQANQPEEIPKDLFAEEQVPGENQHELGINTESKGIELIYEFLQADYESRGYNDALTSPDDSYKQDNIKLIKLDLQIVIQKVTTYYEDLIKELDFHITSRSRAGLIDLVEELKTRKDMVLEHAAKVDEIKKEMEDVTSMTQRIILSYQRGFMRGLSAISQSNVMNKKL